MKHHHFPMVFLWFSYQPRGNQYGLTALAESCAERLSSMLSAQNVVQVLQVLGRNEGAIDEKSSLVNSDD